ncbi:peptidoglycan/LPS O-acetylase OafA/YrhL [Saccharothrix coeruleofusca]|uniref:acyltransferase family protein n=1 Tax=Saccharothrix coeruleofusca TaxID=33919 RepID=UPI001AE4EA09|nr:acyltransferase [Saccharothrix coeruleofusca]MBP2340028.1 peptidoglycan/LPS O-acetylase OafA/YrhL [Saccharothrix coeruleofusca]
MTSSPTERAPATTTGAGEYLHGLDLLRVIASCAVVLTHLSAWFALNHEEFWLAELVERGLVDPLHLNPRLSFLGVALFLLVSGVVVTHVADRERPLQFLRKRVVRLLPLLWVVTALAWALINLGLRVSAEREGPLDLGDLLSGLALANFFQSPQVALAGVTWTLQIQVAFYCYVALTIPVLRRRPWVPPLGLALLSFVLLLLNNGVQTAMAQQIGKLGVYLPVVCIGQLISLAHSRKVGPVAATAIGAVHFTLFTWADKVGGYTFQGEAMPRTLLVATLLVVLLVAAGGPVSRSAVVRGWSKRTYAIYLVHLSAMYPLYDALMPHLDHTLVAVLGLAWAMLLAEALHRWVEVPADRAVRRWEKRRSAR